MHVNNALRARVESGAQGPFATVTRISEYKRAPMHFDFNIPLLKQAELKRDEYEIPAQEIASFIEYVGSRQWSPDDLPDGADAWMVVPDAARLFDGYHRALKAAHRKLMLKSTLHVVDELVGLPNEQMLRTLRTSQSMALMRQKQPRTPLLVLAVQLGFGGHHNCLSSAQVDKRFVPGEFMLGDFELSNILATYPGCLENSQDRGLIAGGDRFDDYAPAYRVNRRTLLRQLKQIEDIDHSFRVATAIPFK